MERNMKPEIGKKYTVIDTLGMMSFEREYIGMGELFKKTFVDDYYTSDHKQFYVFERNEEDFGYKYCVAHPLFKDLEWSGYFQAVAYSNVLEKLFSPQETQFRLI